MCRKACKHLFDACDECIEDACTRHRNFHEHAAVLAVVPASDDEWRRRLDEEAPLVISLTSLQGFTYEKE